MRLINFVFLFSALIISTPLFAQGKKTEIVIGTTAGDFADLVKHGLKPILEKNGYAVKLIEFTDYVTPNLALEEKRLSANIFQHKPYLDEFAKEKGLHLKAVAEVPTAPLGIYAGKTKALKDVKNKAVIAIPNDATNLSRALTILSELGWVKISPKANPILVSVRDITENKKELNIKLLEAAQLPRIVSEVDFAIINGNYATNAGIGLETALAKEKSDLYINWLVVRESDQNSEITKALIQSLNDDAFKKFSESRFKGYKFPKSWKK